MIRAILNEISMSHDATKKTQLLDLKVCYQSQAMNNITENSKSSNSKITNCLEISVRWKFSRSLFKLTGCFTPSALPPWIPGCKIFVGKCLDCFFLWCHYKIMKIPTKYVRQYNYVSVGKTYIDGHVTSFKSL